MELLFLAVWLGKHPRHRFDFELSLHTGAGAIFSEETALINSEGRRRQPVIQIPPFPAWDPAFGQADLRQQRGKPCATCQRSAIVEWYRQNISTSKDAGTKLIGFPASEEESPGGEKVAVQPPLPREIFRRLRRRYARWPEV